ncbi:MAG: YHS domain-containing protein [Chloroflexi bacterium]|nr:YHS domain-containing protein [Chloroflexota bacterium]
MGCPRQCLETRRRDQLAAAHARPERPALEPLERLVDELQLVGRAIAQREVALLLEDLGRCRRLRAVGHLAGRLDRLAEVRDEARALSLQCRTNVDRIDGCHRRTVRPAAVARRPIYTPREYESGGYPMATATDPVCGMQVDTATSQLSLDHDGTTYWFCGKGCLLEFQDDPDKYLAPDYTPSM